MPKKTQTKKQPTLKALAAKMARLREGLDNLKDQERAVRAEYDVLRKAILPEAMRQAGLLDESGNGSFTTSDGKKVVMSGLTSGSILKEDQPAVYDWFRENGLSGLISETVHYQTLSAFVRERMESGEDLHSAIRVDHERFAVLRSR